MAIFLFFKKNIYKVKRLYILFLFLIIFKIIIKERYFLIDDNDIINKYLPLRNKPENLNDSLIIKEKISILELLSENFRRNITSVDTIFLSPNCKFGNCLVVLNISIKVGKEIKCDNISSLYYDSMSPFYSFFYIKPEIRINLIRNEIIRNLNKINLDKENLYIHIRSGDIFFYAHTPYAQPPFCFYRKILNSHKFHHVYLIAQDKNNPIIDKILNEYTNVIYKQNGLKEDLSYLINAYNIVASISSFLISIIQLNYNLETLFDYNIYQLSEKILAYHYDLYQYPHDNFVNYRMEPSPNYNKTMFIWKNNKRQRNLMIKEKCINNFSIINISNYKYNLNN